MKGWLVMTLGVFDLNVMELGAKKWKMVFLKVLKLPKIISSIQDNDINPKLVFLVNGQLRQFKSSVREVIQKQLTYNVGMFRFTSLTLLVK